MTSQAPKTANDIFVLFKEHGWIFKNKTETYGYFYKKNHPGKFIMERQQCLKKEIKISVPIPNSEYQFLTYYSIMEDHIASYDLIKHLHNYESRNYIYPKQLPTAHEEPFWLV
jgi:hypothetical protein